MTTLNIQIDIELAIVIFVAISVFSIMLGFYFGSRKAAKKATENYKNIVNEVLDNYQTTQRKDL